MNHAALVVLFVVFAAGVYFIEEVKPSITQNINEVRGAMNENR